MTEKAVHAQAGHGPGIWKKVDGIADVCYVIRPNIPSSWHADIDHGASLWSAASTELNLTKHAGASVSCPKNYVVKGKIDGRLGILAFAEVRRTSETIVDCDQDILNRIVSARTIFDTEEAWFLGSSAPPNCDHEDDVFSVRLVSTHEMGHWLQIPHIGAGRVMSWLVGESCLVINALGTSPDSDIAQAQNLYCP